jgi:hypothetical protein
MIVSILALFYDGLSTEGVELLLCSKAVQTAV